MKTYRVTLTGMASVSTSVLLEVEDDQVDEDGAPIDEIAIEDMALNQAFDGMVDWEYDGVDDDTIGVCDVTLVRG